MPLLSDQEIIKRARSQSMIDPFVSNQIRKADDFMGGTKKVISFGTSSYGYDIRLSTHFKKLDPAIEVIDPKNITEDMYRDIYTNVLYLEPNSFILAKTVERFKMPHDVMGLCTGKSTYARSGIFLPLTPLEPAWEGVLTLEIANLHKTATVVLHANEGIAQILFLESMYPCNATYADRDGKYQHQEGIEVAKV